MEFERKTGRNTVSNFQADGKRWCIPPLHLLLTCCGSPRHVMNRSYGNLSRRSFWSADQIDHAGRYAVSNGVAEAVSLFRYLLKTTRLSKQ